MRPELGAWRLWWCAGRGGLGPWEAGLEIPGCWQACGLAGPGLDLLWGRLGLHAHLITARGWSRNLFCSCSGLSWGAAGTGGLGLYGLWDPVPVCDLRHCRCQRSLAGLLRKWGAWRSLPAKPQAWRKDLRQLQAGEGLGCRLNGQGAKA